MKTSLKITLTTLSAVLTLTLAQPAVAAPSEQQCQDLRARCAAGDENACKVADRLCWRYPVLDAKPQQHQPLIFRR